MDCCTKKSWACSAKFSTGNTACLYGRSEQGKLKTGCADAGALTQEMRSLAGRLGQQAADLVPQGEITFPLQGRQFFSSLRSSFARAWLRGHRSRPGPADGSPPAYWR